MTKDEINLAFRLVAMGRVNHPEVERLTEKLEAVFAAPVVAPVAAGPSGEARPAAAAEPAQAVKRAKKA